MSGIDWAAIDTSEWNVHIPCYCAACRTRRHQEQMELLREVLKDADLRITLRLWPPRLPFEWPTTQKAICA